MSTGLRKTGEFCWINMITPQPQQAREFFSQLLGWTYFEMPGMGHGMKVDGRDIGAMFDQAHPNTPPGTPPHIGVMVKVESATATAEKAKSLGGKVSKSFDMGHLRMACCTDPLGAEIDIWEPVKAHGTDADSSKQGAPSWFELVTTDVNRSGKFYSSLFAWTPQTMPMPEFNYTVFHLGGTPVAGMMPILPRMGNMRPTWITYFTVTDIDNTAREAIRLGGKLPIPVQDIPNIGRFCGIASPQGVGFCVIQYNRKE
jgi:uncharacterized protein